MTNIPFNYNNYDPTTNRLIANHGGVDRISVTTWTAFGLLLMARFVNELDLLEVK